MAFSFMESCAEASRSSGYSSAHLLPAAGREQCSFLAANRLWELRRAGNWWGRKETGDVMGPSKLIDDTERLRACCAQATVGGTSRGVTVAPKSGKAGGAGWRLGRTEQVRVSGFVWEVVVTELSSVLSREAVS